MIIEISHQLSFATGGAARAVQHLLLTPLSGPTQTVKDWAIEMPGIETAARFIDAFGNRALLVNQAKPGEQVAIAVKGRVETHDRNGVVGRIPGEPVVALYRRVTELTAPDARLVETFRDAERRGQARIALFHNIMDRIAEFYRFGDAEPAATAQTQSQSQGGQSQSQNGQSQSQSQDGGLPAADAATFAHAFVGTVRALELPARYVTGYLAAEDGRPAAFHAWAEAYDDALGWIGFDAALAVCPTDRHVRIAAGLDALSTKPVRVVPDATEIGLVGISVDMVAAQ